MSKYFYNNQTPIYRSPDLTKSITLDTSNNQLIIQNTTIPKTIIINSEEFSNGTQTLPYVQMYTKINAVEAAVFPAPNSTTLQVQDTILLTNSGNSCNIGVDISGNSHIITSGNIQINSLFQNSLWNVTQNAYNNNEIYSYSNPTASLRNFYTPTNVGKWVGGVVAPNGNIYCIPNNSTTILVINPITDTDASGNFGADLTGSSKWWGGCLGSDGKIYGVPESSNDVLVIDASSNTIATRTDFGLDLTNGGAWTSTKWIGGVVGLDGKIYCIPNNATKILVIDPANQTAELTDFGVDLTGSSKWWGGAMGTDGKIYCIPVGVSDFLIIDTINQTATRNNLGLTVPGDFPWLGAVLGSDGKIYGVPFGPTAPGVLVIDTNTQIATINTFGINFSDGVFKWVGGCLGADGKIYCAPESATNFLIIDPVKQTAVRSTLGVNITALPNNKYRGCILSQNGLIYMIPYRKGEVCKLTHPSATPYTNFITRHPALNKF